MTMQGNTILVAGGTRGIGRGLAELLCRLGNEVIVFDAEPGVAAAVARAQPGMRAVDLDLGNPWCVAGFCEQVAATCPGLNMLVDIDIAFPLSALPGLQALLEAADSHRRREAHRLGMQHLGGALLPHFRKRVRSAVFHVSVGPASAVPQAGRSSGLASSLVDSGLPASALSVRRRWVSACIEVVDVALPSRAERMSPDHAPAAGGMSRTEFLSGLTPLLAEGLHETAALARLQALWPRARPAPRQTLDDDLVSPAH